MVARIWLRRRLSVSFIGFEGSYWAYAALSRLPGGRNNSIYQNRFKVPAAIEDAKYIDKTALNTKNDSVRNDDKFTVVRDID